MNPLEDLPMRLVRAQADGKLRWTELEGPFNGSYLYTDQRERIGLHLQPSNGGVFSKRLDAYLTLYHDGHEIREYTGNAVTELYALVHLNANPVRIRDERETDASAALERLLG